MILSNRLCEGVTSLNDQTEEVKSSEKPSAQENTNRTWLLYESWNQKCDRIRCLHSTTLQSTWKKNPYSENPKPNSIFRNHKPYSEKAIPFYRKLQKQTTCLTTNTP